MLVPWSDFWARNYFIHAWPALESVVANNYARGAVTGLGVVNVILGLGELLGLLSARRPYDEPIPAGSDLRSTDHR
jgi:hypothetical protein